jgi:hypothetical protein
MPDKLRPAVIPYIAEKKTDFFPRKDNKKETDSYAPGVPEFDRNMMHKKHR